MSVPTAHRPYAAAFVEHGRTRPNVVCLSGDLTASCEADDFRFAYPERFYSMGMAEQNMLGVAGGMARSGLEPFVHTFGVFATRRALDQLEMAVALPRARVRVMGFLPGLTTPGGPTHQAIDDVAITSALPRMTVVDFGDATEIRTGLAALDAVDGPVYCRVMRGDVPVVFDSPFELGRVRVLSRGSDLCLVSSSICTIEAIAAAGALRTAGVGVAHLHASTLKPFTDPAVAEAIAGARAVITLENHLVDGGLGSAVATLIAEEGLGARLVRLGLRDTYAGGGSQAYLFARHGMTAQDVVAAAERLLGIRVAAAAGGAAIAGPGDVHRQEAL